MTATHDGNVRMEPTKRVEMKLSGRVSIYPILAGNFAGALGFSASAPSHRDR
jgi:nitrate reductase NapE component